MNGILYTHQRVSAGQKLVRNDLAILANASHHGPYLIIQY